MKINFKHIILILLFLTIGYFFYSYIEFKIWNSGNPKNIEINGKIDDEDSVTIIITYEFWTYLDINYHTDTIFLQNKKYFKYKIDQSTWVNIEIISIDKENKPLDFEFYPKNNEILNLEINTKKSLISKSN